MAEVHKHRWEYPPTTQLVRKCIDCGLKQEKRTSSQKRTNRGEWVATNWQFRTVPKEKDDEC